MWSAPETKKTQERIDAYRSKLKPLHEYTEIEMEYVLINDVLKALKGLDSNYIMRNKECI